MRKVLSWIFYISYPIVLIMLFASLLTTTPYMRISKGLYRTHDQIYYDHMYVARQLIDYINYRHDDMYFGEDENDPNPVMTQIAIDHMVDVREVYTRLRVTAVIALLLAVSSLVIMGKKDTLWLYQTLKQSFWLPLAFVVFVGTWFVIDFGRIFTWFHLLFFDGGWQLPSIEHPHYPGVFIADPLILIVPEAFWLVSGVLILIGVIFAYLLTLFINHKLVRRWVLSEEKK